jgi:DHA1 family inner membrane transport protein
MVSVTAVKPTPLSRMPWALIAAASLGMFTAAASGTTRAPFLIEMAHDLSSSVPLVANLVAVTSIGWGLAAMVVGAGSDRWGRRPFLIGGPLALAGASAGVATAESFLTIAAWAVLGADAAASSPALSLPRSPGAYQPRSRGGRWDGS